MVDRTEGPLTKIARADEHIDNLEVEIRCFKKRDPYGFSIHNEADTGDRVYRAIVRENPPLRWSTIAGDAVHNLRSALDLLVWQLVLANQRTPGNHTMFPIARSANDYETRGTRQVEGISAPAKEVLDALKPYEGGNDALWRLHRLDANDKHQLLAVVGAAYRGMIFDFSSFFDIVLDEEIETPYLEVELAPHATIRVFPLKDSDELLRVDGGATTLADTKMEPKFVFEIALSDGEVVEGEPVSPVLRELSDYTKGVVESFTSFL
jgi:hypothetical protein